MIMEQVLNLPLNEADRKIIKSISSQFAKKEVVIGIFGSFSVGKSELINRLLNREGLLPTHVNETTAIPTFISAGEEDKIVAISTTGDRTSLDSVQLHSYIAGYKVDEIEQIDIQLNTPSWLNNIQFIDTPGRNTKFKSHIDASEAAILQSDAVLYVMPWQGLTMEDIVYIKKLLVYQQNLFFVINKVDRINEAEGISIEQLKEKVEADLEMQFGKKYPVFTVSAKTGYNMEQLYTHFILPIANNLEELKKDRFNHAITHFLNRQKDIVENEMHFLQLALIEDTTSFDAERQKVQVQYAQIEVQIADELYQMKELLAEHEIDMDRMLNEEIVQIANKIELLVDQNGQASAEQLQVHLENIIVTTRQSIVSKLTARITKILGEDVTYSLKPIQAEHSTLNYTEMNFDELSSQFEAEKQQLVQRFEAKSAQLKSLPQVDISVERGLLEQELKELAAQAAEQYIPTMIIDETHDPRKAEKILRVAGFVGDIALAVGLAVVTSGVSAAAQVGGKVAAKEATKAAVKKTAQEAAKKAAKEAAIKAAKNKMKQELVEKGLRLVTEALDQSSRLTKGSNDLNLLVEVDKMKKGEQSPLLTAVKTLDAVTSPVETLAAKIGQSIDGNREVVVTEDIEQRNQFFAQKYEVELHYQNRLVELRKLEQQVQGNELLHAQLEKKLEHLQQKQQTQVQKMEKERQESIQKLQQQHFKKQLDAQVRSIVEEEKQHYSQWIQSEFARIYQTVETMLPKHYYGELSKWEEKLEEVEQMKQNQSSEVKSEMEELEVHLQTCISLLESVYDVQPV